MGLVDVIKVHPTSNPLVVATPRIHPQTHQRLGTLLEESDLFRSVFESLHKRIIVFINRIRPRIEDLACSPNSLAAGAPCNGDTAGFWLQEVEIEKAVGGFAVVLCPEIVCGETTVVVRAVNLADVGRGVVAEG